ncbi:unnamed protein product [Rotaria sp. Silwood1]|nr:unnamed protein product [Rotaria sp. Silwood1]CAF1061972.1 unnamed protein product [Rotaria sp. Silwood1]CAF3404783.1 unnamed protein product [Rotaria sp. Silwood1]CAF3474359.1 unnamed protein product [Rotaria sp. Silwood1]CAF4706364.1 unnamed protein product [Rotaria sp. Silwood1]
MSTFHFGKAEYSINFFLASILIFISTCCCISAFASPYWTKRYQDTPKDFQNIGLWELCLYKYRHYKDDLQIPYTGCFWFWTNEMYRFRDWIIPSWFKWVQAFATLGLIFTITTISSLVVAVFSSFRWQWRYQLIVCIMSFAIFVFELIAVCVYGIYSQDRLWMPRPEFNYLSYSYWLECGGLIFAFCACVLFAGEIQFLREYAEDYIDVVHQEKKFPYSSSNGSHLHLTEGHARLSQFHL